MSGEALHRCPKCGTALIATRFARYVNERCVSSVWSCETCGGEFEASVIDQGLDMSSNHGEFKSETSWPRSISLTDEPDTHSAWISAAGSDKSESLGVANRIVGSLYSGPTRSHEINIDQQDRPAVSAVFHDGLAIRAGLVVIVLIASCGLAWIIRSSLNPNLSSSSPSAVSSSAAIPDSKEDRLQTNGKTAREIVGEVSSEDNPQHLASSASSGAKPSPGAAPTGPPAIEHSTGLRQHTTSIRLSAKDPESRTKLTPVRETRPTTIEGWTLREVANGIAVLEGPNGIRRVRRGDTVPGLGRIDSIVLWGQRWIVATSQGLISAP
jgi:predicted RNA-binding Zn-ribbon protein involved in translation (DUF1610 family)